MKFFKIEYRTHSWDSISVIVVSANSPAEAIEKAGLQDAYEYSVSEYIPYKLGNKTYTRRYNTYNAVWMNHEGNVAYWGSYSPDGNYYLATPDGTLAIGTWVEFGNGEYEFQYHGTYSFNDIRRALQLGIFI